MSTLLADPGLRSALESMVRRRVPASEVDDIVQATFTEALGSKTKPDDPEALRRWIFGVARNKVVDFHRRSKREAPADGDLPEQTAEEMAHSDRDLLRWAEKELPPGKDAPKTLEWMLREGAGEKLESIAEAEKIPAPTVRQRVHRLRSYMKKRWAAEIALVAALGLAALAFWIWQQRKREPPIAEEPRILSPRDMAKELRRNALEQCDKGEWDPCVKMLDRAAAGDPEGDTDPRVQKAREDAKRALTPPAPSATPTTSEILPPAPPPPKPTATPPSDLKQSPKPLAPPMKGKSTTKELDDFTKK